MILRPIGQSGYILKTKDTEITIDPYLSDIVNRVANRPRMVEAPIHPRDIDSDAVICTHNHMDHLDPDAVVEMPQNTHFVTTGEGLCKLNELGKHSVTVLKEGDTCQIGDMTLRAVYANHTCEAFGLIVEAEGKTLYFSGDTLFDEKLFSIAQYRPDYTFICINGKLGNMNVEEALTVAEKIGAKINVPNHYDMFASNTEDPHKFADRISGGMIMEFNQEYIL